MAFVLKVFKVRRFPFNVPGPRQIPQDHRRQSRDRAERTKETSDSEMREVHYGRQRGPKLVCVCVCVGWIMHLSGSFGSCKFAKWQWSKLSPEGMVLRGRLKWLRECKSNLQRGGKRGYFCRLSDSVMTCFTFTLPLFIPRRPSLAIQIGFGNSVWKQLAEWRPPTDGRSSLAGFLLAVGERLTPVFAAGKKAKTMLQQKRNPCSCSSYIICMLRRINTCLCCLCCLCCCACTSTLHTLRPTRTYAHTHQSVCMYACTRTHAQRQQMPCLWRIAFVR